MLEPEKIIIRFNEFDNTLREEIIERMERYTFCVIRGAVSKTSIEKAMMALKVQFRQLDDHPTTGESPKEIQDNFQKLVIGGVAKKYNNFPRFFTISRGYHSHTTRIVLHIWVIYIIVL